MFITLPYKTFVFLLQIYPIRKLYLLNMTFWLDVFQVGVKNSYSTVLWPWHQWYTNNKRRRPNINRKIFTLWFTTIILSKSGNILSFHEILLPNIYTRSSVITSVANGDIYFLYITGTCQYAVIRLVVNYQSPLCFI